MSICLFVFNCGIAFCLFVSLLFVLGFVCLFFHLFPSSHPFFIHFFIFPFFAEPCGLQGLGDQARGQTQASGVRVPSLGRWNARELPAPGNINHQGLSQRSPSQLQDLAPPNSLQARVLNAQPQTTSKTGTQSHPTADRVPKVILSPQTPQNTPLDMTLSTIGTRHSSTHQRSVLSPSHQEACTRHWTNLTH